MFISISKECMEKFPSTYTVIFGLFDNLDLKTTKFLAMSCCSKPS